MMFKHFTRFLLDKIRRTDGRTDETKNELKEKRADGNGSKHFICLSVCAYVTLFRNIKFMYNFPAGDR